MRAKEEKARAHERKKEAKAERIKDKYDNDWETKKLLEEKQKIEEMIKRQKEKDD